MATSLKIPSPWQSDYAVPAYVRAEGLQMRTYTTKWAPRGNYDDPDAFDPSWEKSWAVPQYVKDEGYGQGTYVTEWAPRGFYVGEIRRLCARMKKTQRTLRDPAGNGTFGAYGRRAAATVLVNIRALPPATRKDALILTIKADADITSPRIIKHQHASARRWYLEVRLEDPAQVDAELASWLKAAMKLAD
jgi:hypothetical protein